MAGHVIIVYDPVTAAPVVTAFTDFDYQLNDPSWTPAAGSALARVYVARTGDDAADLASATALIPPPA